MEITELEELVSTPDELQKKIKELKTNLDVLAKYRKEHDPKQHPIMDTAVRLDKTITDSEGKTSVVKVARLPVPLQKRIVELSASFLAGNPIELQYSTKDKSQEDFVSLLKKVWEDNKLDYETKALAKKMMSETEVAELWYTEEADPEYWEGTLNAGKKFRLRVKILAGSLGDTLIPVYNNMGDMIAFARVYTLKIEGKDVEHLDVYTDKTFYYYQKLQSGWAPAADRPSESNVVGKIPIIYYNQPYPEWYDVQEMIERFEVLISNHADTNDYNGSPMIVVKGAIQGFSKKGESGKILELEADADARYMSWDQAPESVKLEMQNLRSLIFDLTSTPDISIEQMKSLGTYSGIALKMLFLSAHLKAADKEEIFGKGIQRRINYLKSALAFINVSQKKASLLSIKPKFEYYLPKDEVEAMSVLTTAKSGGILSRKTAVKLNPLVEDSEAELTQIEKEENSAPAGDENFNL